MVCITLYKGTSMYYVSTKGGGGGQKLTILLSKKLTNRGGGGSKNPKTRLHNTWMFPNKKFHYYKIRNSGIRTSVHRTLQIYTTELR